MTMLNLIRVPLLLVACFWALTLYAMMMLGEVLDTEVGA